MKFDSKAFEGLVESFIAIGLNRAVNINPPWGRINSHTVPSEKDVDAAITANQTALPLAYLPAYVEPLRSHLARLLDPRLGPDQTNDLLEDFVGPLYVQGIATLRPSLHRFLAVISNLYRSFLDKSKRASVDFPRPIPTLPPLATFKSTAQQGPFTIPNDGVQQTTGGTVGVVSLPGCYADNPLLWASLAHETGGHDVLHADPQLLPELAEMVATMFGWDPTKDQAPTTVNQLLGALWAYWIDETASDVYGILNIGPQFAFNLAAFFAALTSSPPGGSGAPPFTLRNSSGFSADDPAQLLDPHPTDVLRLSVAKGVVSNLVSLSAATRNSYAAAIDDLITAVLGGATDIELVGRVPVTRDRAIPVQQKLPLAGMQQAAFKVGQLIATSKLTTFATSGNSNGRSIQDIETWDDSDDATAAAITAAIGAGTSIIGMGDDAQLLAGATAAVLGGTASYETVTSLLADALDDSLRRDPIWGTPENDTLFIGIFDRSSIEFAYQPLELKRSIQSKPKPTGKKKTPPKRPKAPAGKK
jgi:hypothetical protein